MDLNEIAVYIGIASPVIQGILNCYTTFKKTNVESFFKILLESKENISKIGKRDDLERYFLSIIDKVSLEANKEKINKWKNAVIHLAQDFSDFDYKDNFIRTLDDLTVFDLSVLYKIYSTKFKKEHFEKELIEYFINKGTDKNMVMQAIIRLSSHNLVSEMECKALVFGELEPILREVYYTKNELGKQFLEFASSDNIK